MSINVQIIPFMYIFRGWVYDYVSKNIGNISARIEDMTGLRVVTTKYQNFSEPFQVVNYGIGGQYAPHYDFFQV